MARMRCRSSLAVTLRESGLPKEAEPYFRQVVAAFEAAAARGDSSHAVRRAYSALPPPEAQKELGIEARANPVFCLQGLGKFEECLALQRQGVAA